MDDPETRQPPAPGDRVWVECFRCDAGGVIAGRRGVAEQCPQCRGAGKVLARYLGTRDLADGRDLDEHARTTLALAAARSALLAIARGINFGVAEEPDGQLRLFMEAAAVDGILLGSAGAEEMRPLLAEVDAARDADRDWDGCPGW